MRGGRSTSTGLFVIGIAAIFLAGFFLLVIFGAQSYRSTVVSQSENARTRALHSYLTTVAKNCDSKDAVSLRQDASVGSVLVIADGESGYAIHIFKYDGFLMEDYAPTDAEPSPERAQKIAATESFEAEISDGLIVVDTDAGRVLIRPRSGGDIK